MNRISNRMFCSGTLLWIAAILGAVLLVWANRPLFLAVNGSHFPALDRVMLSITHFGNSSVLAIIVFLAAPFRRDITVRAALSMIIAGIITALAKDLLAMPRPATVFPDLVHVLGPVLHSKSMPSGHTTAAFALAFSLRKAVPRGWYAGALVSAAAVAVSRVYVGAHFPVDVMAGAFVGWLGSRAAGLPSDALAERVRRAGRSFDVVCLILAAVSGIWIILEEPMMRYNPFFLGSVGALGAAAAAVLLVRCLFLERGAS
ncbi:putative undecaprenyl-diphosphatase YbjG [bacterium BMS3Abin14]|nr:putative undecaprenyl-diphosphatase YbjG [bacterium BMS3Abin14]